MICRASCEKELVPDRLEWIGTLVLVVYRNLIVHSFSLPALSDPASLKEAWVRVP